MSARWRMKLIAFTLTEDITPKMLKNGSWQLYCAAMLREKSPDLLRKVIKHHKVSRKLAKR